MFFFYFLLVLLFKFKSSKQNEEIFIYLFFSGTEHVTACELYKVTVPKLFSHNISNIHSMWESVSDDSHYVLDLNSQSDLVVYRSYLQLINFTALDTSHCLQSKISNVKKTKCGKVAKTVFPSEFLPFYLFLFKIDKCRCHF